MMALERKGHTQQEEEIFETMPESLPAPRAPAHKHLADKAHKEGLDEHSAPSARETINSLKSREGEGSTIQGRVEYESLGGPASVLHSFETPEQRLARLQAEVVDLLHMAEHGHHAAGETAREGAEFATDMLGGDPVEIAAELRALEVRLGGLAQHAAFGGGAFEASAQSGSPFALPGSLVGQLERLAGGTEQSRPRGEDGRVTYQINYAPSTNIMAESSKIAALEGSLAEIERQLGVMDPNCPFANLHTAVAHLQRRVAMLDASTLDGISKRVNLVVADIEKMMMKKAELEGTSSSPDMDRKVDELYEFCQRWSSTAASLPAVVTRLRTLQALHQQSTSFASRLAALERQQDELHKLLETTNAAVGELSVGLRENMVTVKENMRILEEKILKAVR